MSIANYHGMKVQFMELPNRSIDEIRQRRACEIYTKKAVENWSIPELCKFYSLSKSYLYEQMASIPDEIKSQLRRGR